MQDRDFGYQDCPSRFERLQIGSDTSLTRINAIEAYFTGAKSSEEIATAHTSIRRSPMRLLLLGMPLTAASLLAASCGIGQGQDGDTRPDSTPIPTPVTRTVPTTEAQPTIVEAKPTATIEVQPTTVPELAQVERARVGQKAPDFTLNDLDGQPVSLSDLAGKPIIIFYYGYGWSASENELQQMINIVNDYGNQGVEILTITMSEREASKIAGQIYPILIDDQKTMQKLYSVQGVPTSFLINSGGVLVDIRSGVSVEEGLDNDVAALVSTGSIPKEPTADESIIKIPLQPTGGSLEDTLYKISSALINPGISDEDFEKIIIQRLEVLDLIHDSYQDVSIDEILVHLKTIGQILANSYCQSPNQDTLTALSMLAYKTFSIVERYVEEGVLDPNEWRETVESFNPPCEVVHTLPD